MSLSLHFKYFSRSTMTGRGKGGKGLGKGGAKRHRKVLRDNIQVNDHRVWTSLLISCRASPSLQFGASQEGVVSSASAVSSMRRPGVFSRFACLFMDYVDNLVPGFPGECHQRCCDLHRACQEEDCDCHGRGVRSEEAGQDPLWLWRIVSLVCTCDQADYFFLLIKV